jgi:hypothetical protein
MHVPDTSSKRSIILKIFAEELPQAQLELLPDETKRIVRPGYEEYSIPPAPTIKDEFQLIPIKAFDDWAQLAFKGITHLNRFFF